MTSDPKHPESPMSYSSNPYLTAALALALGVSATLVLKSRDAIGYPAGAVISLGTNPIVQAAGTAGALSGSALLFAAPAGQRIIVTDVVLTGHGYDSQRNCNFRVGLDTGEAVRLASFQIDTCDASDNSHNQTAGSIQHAFSAGIPLEPGESLNIVWTYVNIGCDLDWTISGYQAEP